jgi:EAL domain-containing protein (putative c-di-GMP-specific phosphodiesterase class I)
MDCDLAQGYHVSRPLAPSDFVAWLDASAATRSAGAGVRADGH